MRNDDVKPNYCLVAFDELKFYNVEPDDARWIKAIWQTYVYDAHQYTYCCEITPSYFLEPVYTSVEVTTDCPDEIREALAEKYEWHPSDAGYWHVRVVKDYVERHPERHHVYGEAESIDEAREYYQGNYPF